MGNRGKPPDEARLERAVVDAQRARVARERGYREQALKLFPWVCGRCGRTFDQRTVRELTVHHRDHDHDRNPPDGSNWELLCLYCHDNEHRRALEATPAERPGSRREPQATHRPFEALRAKLKPDDGASS